MTLLTSRPAVPQASSVSPQDIADLVTQSGVRVKITEDHTIDPPEMRIVQEAVWPFDEETLLIKPAGDPISMYDLMLVIDRLGFPVDYEELK